MRGRVIAILLAIALGGTPIGAPIVGWVADSFGPRWALGSGSGCGLRRSRCCNQLSREDVATLSMRAESEQHERAETGQQQDHAVR